MNHREVMQMALEVLEASVDQLPKPYSTDCSNAITALRAALAEPEQDNRLLMQAYRAVQQQKEQRTEQEQKQAIVDALTTGTGWLRDGKRVDPTSVYSESEQADTVTLTQTNVGIGERAMEAYEAAKQRGWSGVSDERLMKMPAEFVCSTGLCSYRRPLTDEEIDRVIERHASGSDWSDAEYESAVSFARAIERAHGIKQEEA